MYACNQINLELCVLIKEKKLLTITKNKTEKIKRHAYIKIFSFARHII
jgi:hypothetical protein